MMGRRERVRELEKLLERIMEKLENRRVKYSRRRVRVQEVICPREVLEVGCKEGLEGGQTGNRKPQERFHAACLCSSVSLAGGLSWQSTRWGGGRARECH